VNKKFIVFLVLFVVISVLNIEKIIFQKQYIWQSSDLPKSIDFSIPFITSKIDIDLNSEQNNCHQYIDNQKIFFDTIYNNKKITLKELNTLEYGSIITLNVDKTTNTLVDCNFSVLITDPYGNMDKELLLIILPTLIVFYLVFKMGWLFVVKKIKALKYR